MNDVLLRLNSVILCSGKIRDYQLSEEAMKSMVRQLRMIGKKMHGAVFGELGFPESFDSYRLTTIEWKNVSHKLIKIRLENGNILADVIIMNTKAGHKLFDMIKEKEFRFGFRGKVEFADTEETTIKQVVPVTYDAIPASETYPL